MVPVGAPARNPGPSADFGPAGGRAAASPAERGTEPNRARSEASAIRENLFRLRADRELTQRQLAEKAGVSRATVGKIERGLVAPKTLTVARLARALRTSLGDLALPVRRLRSVRFRARSRMRGREQILAEVSRWLDAYRMLEQALDDRRPFRFDSIRHRRKPVDPAAAARAARKAVGIASDAPITDICRLLEDGGVKVLRLDKKRDSFFGLSVGPVDGGPAIVVNTWDRISVERWIFTAAHELGHLLLHPDEYDATVTEHAAATEREADRFAGEFLMPEAAFTPVWNSTWGCPVEQRVLEVKRFFRVSYQTVLYRLVATERESAAVRGHFRSRYRERYGRTLGRTDEPEALTESAFAWNSRRADEPAGLSEFDFTGNRLHRLLRKALLAGEVSMSRGAEILGLPLREMRVWVRGWIR